MTHMKKYFELQFEYELFYKEKVVILKQSGNFYDFYEYNHDLCINSKSMIYNKKIGYVSELSNILGLRSFHKNSQESHSIDNPIMTGFLVTNYEKYINKILEHSYIVIKLDYCKADPSLKHCVTEIIHPY